MRWPVRVVAATGSTNADLVAAARAGDRGPRVLAARRQDSGRGRLDRGWASPDGASLAVSWLWRPTRAQQDWPWLPMVVGLGVLDAVASLGVRAGLKWPNDVVVPLPADTVGPEDGATHGLRKLAGILVEVVSAPDGRACAVAGVGLNVGLAEQDLPVPTATSVLVETGRDPGFDAALAAVLTGVGERLDRWSTGDGRAGDPAADPALRADYRAACTTLGRLVHVTTPGGAVRGTAVDVDEAGCLVVREHGTHDDLARPDVRVSAGDVEHVR